MRINDLRANALAMQRKANAKVSRNKSKGVELAGTRFDPREKQGFIANATSKQLRNYVEELNTFLDRGQQFVGDRTGAPIHVSQWRYYKQVEKKRNAKVKADNDLVANIFIQESGLTAGERHALMDKTRNNNNNPTVNHDWRPIDRSPANINGGPRSLTKLTDVLKKTTHSDYNNNEAIIGRQTIAKMAARLNAPELKKAVEGLSQQQFWFLWKNTKFAGDLAEPYHELMATGEMQASDNDAIAQNLNMALRQAKWANKLDIDVKMK